MSEPAPNSDLVLPNVLPINKASVVLLGLAVATIASMIHLVAVRLPSLRDDKLVTVLEDLDTAFPPQVIRVIQFPTVAVLSVAVLVATVLVLKERMMKNRMLCLSINSAAVVVALITSIYLTEMHVNAWMETIKTLGRTITN